MAKKIISVSFETRSNQRELIDSAARQIGLADYDDSYEEWDGFLDEVPEYLEFYFEIDTETRQTVRLGTYDQLTEEQRKRA